MTPEELREERNKLSDQYDNSVEKLLDRYNSQLWGLVASILFTLDTTKDGRIKFTVSNINRVRSIGFKVAQFNQQKGASLVQWIITRALRLFGLSTDYFKASDIDVSQSRENRILSKIMKMYGYDIESGTLDPNGYFAANVSNINQGQAIAERIRQAIASRQGLNTFSRQFRNDFNKTGSPLSMHYHYRRFTRDFFNQHDRLTQLAYAQDLKLNFALYSHTIIRTSRCFCRRRSNRIYSLEFARKWNQRRWKGKIPGVDVMIAQGGYNCRGTWSFMSDGTATALSNNTGREINTYNRVFCIE